MGWFNKLFAWHKVVQPDFYTHTVHEPFTNGAMEYGFVRRFVDPLLMLTGTGYIPGKHWMVEQPPQVYTNLAVPPSWVGGVPGGSPVWQTELFNNDASNGSFSQATGDYTTSYDQSL